MSIYTYICVRIHICVCGEDVGKYAGRVSVPDSLTISARTSLQALPNQHIDDDADKRTCRSAYGKLQQNGEMRVIARKPML